MGRVPRTSLPDGYFHVFSRGVAGGPIFLDNADRSFFLTTITLCEQRHRWICYAFTLLSTHYHLVLETSLADLSAGLQRLNGRYAHRFNKRHGRFGHVFAERFSAKVIESEQYLYDVCAYVVLNPVSAGLCDRVEDWPWSYNRFEASPI